MTAARDRGGSHPAELVAASLLFLLVLTSLLLWLAGGFAGLAFGGHWPRVAASDLPGVGLRLHDHLDDPRAAWPAQARAGLPGPIGMYVGARRRRRPRGSRCSPSRSRSGTAPNAGDGGRPPRRRHGRSTAISRRSE